MQNENVKLAIIVVEILKVLSANKVQSTAKKHDNGSGQKS